MKTTSGKVISSRPVSLSQAARTISTFVSADNGGASQAVTTYLKRTSVAFNELVQFHKDHKAPNFKTKKTRKVDPVNSGQVRVENLENGEESKKNKQSPVTLEQKGIEVQGKIGEEEGVEGDGERKKEKRKKKTQDVERESEGDLGIEEEGKKEMKWKKSKEVEENSLEQIGHIKKKKKKKKKRRVEGDD